VSVSLSHTPLHTIPTPHVHTYTPHTLHTPTPHTHTPHTHIPHTHTPHTRTCVTHIYTHIPYLHRESGSHVRLITPTTRVSGSTQRSPTLSTQKTRTCTCTRTLATLDLTSGRYGGRKGRDGGGQEEWRG